MEQQLISHRGNLVNATRNGLSFANFDRLRRFLNIQPALLADVLSISDRTLARRKSGGKLSPVESDRLVRVVGLVELALEVFEGHKEGATRWFTSPKTLLKGESPLQRSDTEPGCKEVETMLYSIEYGMSV